MLIKVIDFDFKRRDHDKRGTGQVDMLLSSLYNEFEMKVKVDLPILLESQTISENEYREIWMSIPKEDHITFELNVSGSVLEDGIIFFFYFISIIIDFRIFIF